MPCNYITTVDDVFLGYVAIWRLFLPREQPSITLVNGGVSDSKIGFVPRSQCI
jgi:hypothetical protein